MEKIKLCPFCNTWIVVRGDNSFTTHMKSALDWENHDPYCKGSNSVAPETEEQEEQEIAA
jgi:hypothetical protein